jgi:hypothetical protein
MPAIPRAQRAGSSACPCSLGEILLVPRPVVYLEPVGHFEQVLSKAFDGFSKARRAGGDNPDALSTVTFTSSVPLRYGRGRRRCEHGDAAFGQ